MFGALGQNVLYRAQEMGYDFKRFWAAMSSAAPSLSLGHTAKEWRDIYQQTLLEPAFRELDPNSVIPDSLYRQRTILQATPYAYRVHIYGRSLETGRYSKEDVFLHTVEPYTSQEAIDTVMGRISETGASPKYDVFTVDVRGAFTRSDEQVEWD